MKILVTGANGFIGKNLIAELNNRGYHEIYSYDIDTDPQMLDNFCSDCDFVFNLAGVNRPKNNEDFIKGNFEFADHLLDELKKYNNKCPVMLSSSIQADLDNPYGHSKQAGEKLFFKYGEECNTEVYVYRFPNVFGKWCRPNYNSAVATFCNNIAKGLPITVNDRNTELTLVYIDDVVEELIAALEGNANIEPSGFCKVPVEHKITLGEIVDLLYSFKSSRESLQIPDMTEGSFSKKLYSTIIFE